jgi:hypothetical protein
LAAPKQPPWGKWVGGDASASKLECGFAQGGRGAVVGHEGQEASCAMIEFLAPVAKTGATGGTMLAPGDGMDEAGRTKAVRA